LRTARLHSTTRRTLAALPFCLGALAFVPTIAEAQTASPEDVAAARGLGTEGTRLADAGDCKNAIPKLEAAEKLFHAPTTLGRLGECQVATGKLVAGTENLNRVVRESLAPNAPAAFVAAKKRAEGVLAAAKPRIGTLRIHVDGPTADKITLTVDGLAVSTALLDADRPTDPGVHEVSATAPGYKPGQVSVNVGEAGQSAASLKLVADPDAVANSTTPATVGPTTPLGPTPAEKPASSGNGMRIGSYVALGVGGVGVALGAIFGSMALGTKSKLDKDCQNKICPTSSQSDVDALSTQSTVSTIGFIVGAVGVGAGVTLLVLSNKHQTTTGEAPKPTVSPWVGLGSAGVRGTFE
jgi:hypothetical protein